MAPKHKKSKTSGGQGGGGGGGAKSAKAAKAIAEARAKADIAPITHMTQDRQHRHGGFAKFDNKEQSDKLKPKEKTEVELENLIFGGDHQEAFSRIGHELSSDEEGDALDDFDYDLEVGELGSDGEEGEGVGGDMEDGGDMFFMDAGPTPVEREEINEDELDEDEEEPVDEEIGEGDVDEDEGASEDEEVSRLTGEFPYYWITFITLWRYICTAAGESIEQKLIISFLSAYYN
jgi:hypothetical protein